jgi:hypothetical protein
LHCSSWDHSARQVAKVIGPVNVGTDMGATVHEKPAVRSRGIQAMSIEAVWPERKWEARRKFDQQGVRSGLVSGGDDGVGTGSGMRPDERLDMLRLYAWQVSRKEQGPRPAGRGEHYRRKTSRRIEPAWSWFPKKGHAVATDDFRDFRFGRYHDHLIDSRRLSGRFDYVKQHPAGEGRAFRRRKDRCQA